MSVSATLLQYADLAKKVFSSRKMFGKPHNGVFKASNLEEAIKETVQVATGRDGAEAMMMDPNAESLCKT